MKKLLYLPAGEYVTLDTGSSCVNMTQDYEIMLRWTQKQFEHNVITYIVNKKFIPAFYERNKIDINSPILEQEFEVVEMKNEKTTIYSN